MADKMYKVSGVFKGVNINQTLRANSSKQAKLRAGFLSGLGGSSMRDFMKSRSIRVAQI